MINPINDEQTALHDATVGEEVPENIDLYGVDWDQPLPVENLNIVEVNPGVSISPEVGGSTSISRRL